MTPGLKRGRLLLPVLLCGLAAAAPRVAFAAVTDPPPERPAPTAPMEFFPVSDIRPGLTGVARTVFAGDQLEEFGVEFLGVLKNAIGPQQDMILARLTGEKVEFTGVVAGMSGSPVYVDGKLVGAISYRLGNFAKEAIAGITPIAEMVKLEGARSSRRAGGASPGALAGLLAWLPRGADRGLLPALPSAPASASSHASGLERIGTPLVCAGCDPGVLRHYAPAFEAIGLTPTSGGGAIAGSDPLRSGPLLPGTAIGAALATGDLNLSAFGTLTHVDGNRIFAFGHPMLGVGSIEVPMTQGQVLLTFASSAASFKIANATAPIGAIVEDRLTAIVGEVGRIAPTLPLTVRVRSGEALREFHYDVVRDRSWAPLVVAVTTANSLVRTTEFDAAATVALHYRITLEGFPEVRYEELYSGTNPNQPVHLLAANDAGGLLGLLGNNPFQEPNVLSAEADIELLEGAQVAALTSLSVSKSEVRPGEPFQVDAELTPFRGRPRAFRFEVALPEDTPPGDLVIIVAGGTTMDGLDRRVQERQLQQASSLNDIIRIISRQRKGHALYLRAARRSPSAIVGSEVLPELPLSIYHVLNNPRLSADSTLLAEAPIMEMARDLDLVAIGGRRITLKVK